MAIARLPILMLLPGAMLAGALAAQTPPQQQPPPAQAASHSATVALTGTQQWVPSNIVVAQGDRLVLRARGMQFYNAPLNPAGMPPRYERHNELPLPEAPYMAVVGRIGGGPPFLVGSAYDGSAAASGMLELGLNVRMGEDWSGLMSDIWAGGRRPALFEVTVEHVPQAPPAEPQPEATNTLEENAVNPPENQVTGTDEGAAANVVDNSRNEAAPAGDSGGGPDRSWLVPLLIGAGGMLALVLAGLVLKRLLWSTPTPLVTIHPSLDLGEGKVSGNEITLAGPEIRLRAALVPGVTMFESGEPAVELEGDDG
jgi:hypothetical protein